ncbi:hypothetical protein PTTG_25525 [Puccinia triticina 1-1 BBBD Race 1]|uniref:Uncharacterized protein n=1 Tax=Puccinia triticina (isolate 1-1 / race 1 (BBBD)) TaxID=630390 RepID=A0A180H1A2_PUCT1|nr:hypothetical protein PTTG_25525 [Puccinia triticina 1-1 BBBD Race 1]
MGNYTQSRGGGAPPTLNKHGLQGGDQPGRPFVYLTTLLLNNRNPRPIRQAAMTVLGAYHQPSSPAATRLPGDHSRGSIPPPPPRPQAPPRPQTDLYHRRISRSQGPPRLLGLSRGRERGAPASQGRLKNAVEWSKRGYSPGFPFASETSPGNWHIFGNLLRLTVPLGLCTVDQYNLALLLRCFKELISVFEKHPSVPSLSAA